VRWVLRWVQVNKLLLLGAGESGKSTLFKQMITLYGKGFSESDRMSYLPIIANNIITVQYCRLCALMSQTPGLIRLPLPLLPRSGHENAVQTQSGTSLSSSAR
jgi:hypothetical protein